MQRFFTEPENVKDDEIIIYGNDVKHMKQSLRMKIGDQLEVCDSAGNVYLCSIKEYLKEEFVGRKANSQEKKNNSSKDVNIDIAILGIEKEWQNDTELSSQIYLFQGLPKSDKMELIIQKAVELGVYEIIPVSTARTVVKLDETKSGKKVSRWMGISESAAKQSGRGLIPNINEIMSFSDALEYSKGLDMILFPYELAEDISKTKKIIEGIKAQERIGVFIGPEGGFDRGEVSKAVEAGAIPITLGKRILRTETAAITMLSLLMVELS